MVECVYGRAQHHRAAPGTCVSQDFGSAGDGPSRSLPSTAGAVPSAPLPPPPFSWALDAIRFLPLSSLVFINVVSVDPLFWQSLHNLNNSLQNFIGNLSGRSFLSTASDRSTLSSRPRSRLSRRQWSVSTLSSPLIACKTAWPVSQVESIFLPEFKISAEVEHKNFEIINLISKGAFGKVYKVKKADTQEVLALKVLSKSQIISENAVRQVKDEVHIQEVCGHNPFIVASLLKWQSHKRLYIVSEYIPGGELSALLGKYLCLPEDLVRVYVAEIALVLDFLHNAGVIYRDLKPENLLLNAFGHIQLIDFGLSKWLKYGSRTTTFCGTLQYMAPEIINHMPYGHAVDWWSLGVLTCRMLTDRYPNSDGGDVLKDLQLSPSSRSLLIRLLDPVPNCRLRSLKALQETAFFKDFNFASIRAMSQYPNEILKKHFPNGPKEHLEKSPIDPFNNFDEAVVVGSFRI